MMRGCYGSKGGTGMKNFDEEFENEINLMNDNIHKLECQFLAGELSSEEYARARALAISNGIGCAMEVATMMATCL